MCHRRSTPHPHHHHHHHHPTHPQKRTVTVSGHQFIRSDDWLILFNHHCTKLKQLTRNIILYNNSEQCTHHCRFVPSPTVQQPVHTLWTLCVTFSLQCVYLKHINHQTDQSIHSNSKLPFSDSATPMCPFWNKTELSINDWPLIFYYLFFLLTLDVKCQNS